MFHCYNKILTCPTMWSKEWSSYCLQIDKLQVRLCFIKALIHCLVCSHVGSSSSQQCYFLIIFLSCRPSRCWLRFKPNWMSLRKARNKTKTMITKQKTKMMTRDGKKQETRSQNIYRRFTRRTSALLNSILLNATEMRLPILIHPSNFR